MDKLIECPCGYVVRAKNEDALVSQAQQHAREVHGMDLTMDCHRLRAPSAGVW